MITCTRRIQWCMGHRLLNHEGKCAHAHGHNYVALLTAECEELDTIGRVVDFGVLKERLGGWIEAYWDHGFVVNEKDVALREALRLLATHSMPPGQKFQVVPFNPTAELLADHLLREVGPHVLVGTGVRLVRVELWETENCRAEVLL